jgi:peptide-methionine (S)-S-oxide reductase
MTTESNTGASTTATAAGAASEIATLGGGCFWCIEAVFLELEGVEHVVSGYAGGHVPNPSYDAVCSGSTGHAEVVQVTFDPRRLSYEDLLRVFFSVHDPTTLNRQGPDVGTQYRSAVFTHSPEQQTSAEKVIRELEAAKLWDNRIVTEVTPLPADAFYPAEEYHQNYYANNTFQPYCLFVVRPKVSKFRKEHTARLRKKA